MFKLRNILFIEIKIKIYVVYSTIPVKKLHCVTSNIYSPYRQKHHFDSYILKSQLIWFLHFGNSQFGSYYFQLAVNLVTTVNSLTKNTYVTNGVNSWHI